MNMAPATAPTIEFPAKLQCLFEPKRYKILHGGRGGAKSWGIARALLLIGKTRPIRVLCAREFQNSIQDSVHKLLKDQVYAMGLDDFYTVENTSIKGANGTEFGFEGIRQNVRKVKSWEGADYCWVEEAANVSKNSWEVLVPTIRKPGSEIWISFNPELDADYTYQRYVKNPPEESVVVSINWRDNPWFPEVLRKEMEQMRRDDPDAYLNVWEGHPKQALTGAVYAGEIRQATLQQRITRVPYDPSRPVDCFWDLGHADKTSIWFSQSAPFEYRMVDYYQNALQPLDHYLQVLQRRGYTYGTLWLPHDAKAKTLGTGKSIEEMTRAKGFTVRIVPKLSLTDGINAARTVFPLVYFDEDKCVDGLQALRHYRYENDHPVHDEYSHGADAFRYFGVGVKQPKKVDANGNARAAPKPRLGMMGALEQVGLGWLGK